MPTKHQQNKSNLNFVFLDGRHISKTIFSKEKPGKIYTPGFS